MGQAAAFDAVTVLDVQPAGTAVPRDEIRYSVVIDGEAGFQIFEVGQSIFRALGIMDAFISGASMMLPRDQERVPLPG